MVVNFEGSVINLRDKLAAVDKKKTQNESSQSLQGNESSSSGNSEKQYIADVIGIRNENKLAATSSMSIQTDDEAFDILEQLKQQFQDSSEDAINAHEKASADAVMQFYPFE